jgi:radical SAM superfamily enzyme YgiQ (UPF0313 family)
MKSIVLINPPIQKGYFQSLRAGIFPPLNLGILASYLKNSVNGLSFNLIDGEILQLDSISIQIETDYVGINCNTLTYKSAIEIANAAKAKGARVILGGPYASVLPEKILVNQSSVDCIVVGDGEFALKMLLEGKPYEEIPNLAYRKNGKIVINDSVKTPMCEMVIPDYCTLPLEKYFANHRDRYGQFKPYKAALAIYSMKGCSWRDKTNGGCVFCMIPHFGVTYKKPEHVWNEMLYFNAVHGVDSFWEVSDSFADNIEWLKSFRNAKPDDFNIGLSIYARASSINAEKARLLKEIGVFEVFIGAESGDNQILRNTKKGITTDTVRRAIKLLSDEGINVIVSFVLGLPGETEETLSKTVSFAHELASYDNVNETSTSIMFPMPGSTAFNNLMKIEGMSEKYSSDMLDFEQLKRDWLKHFTQVSFEALETALKEMTGLFVLNASHTRSFEEIHTALDC